MSLYEYQRTRSFIDLGPRSLGHNIFPTFFLEIERPIKVKFYVKLPWDGGTYICSNGLGHMNNMTAMPMYGKNLKNHLLWNQKADDLEN